MLEEIFQGFCMAMADSVPGVSGGSIAFLMGFYNEFIMSLIFYRGRGRKSRWHDNCHGWWNEDMGNAHSVLWQKKHPFLCKSLWV